MNTNLKRALIIGSVIIIALIVLPLIFRLVSGWQGYGYGMMGPGMMGGFGMMGPGMMGGFGWMWLMPVIWIFLPVLIVWSIVGLVRGRGESEGSDFSRTDSALETLNRRYARGEIGKEEYEEKKKDLIN